jgi:hypothetical protein
LFVMRADASSIAPLTPTRRIGERSDLDLVTSSDPK